MNDASNNSCVYFENSLLVASVQYEIEALSKDGLVKTLTHIKGVFEGSIDPDRLSIWHEYRGIPLFLIEYRGELMVYAAETEGGGDALKISIMFAGVRRLGYVGPDFEWDGSDESLWRDVVEPRCRYHFA